MSALPPKADIDRRDGNVCYVPKADICIAPDFLFDHLVGAQKERLRDREAERLGGRQIDYEIKLSWLLDWDIPWLRSTQNLIDQIGGAPE